MSDNPLNLLAAIMAAFVVAGILAIIGAFGLLPGTGDSAPALPPSVAVGVPTQRSVPPASPTASVVVGDSLTVTARNITFDPTTLNARAGGVGIDFRNEDSGTTHNIHFFRGSDASGQSVATTNVTSGPDEQRLSFLAEAGQYFYRCDVHPDQMHGQLVVR